MPQLRIWRNPRVRYLAVLDSGADGSCLPIEIARDLGLQFDPYEIQRGLGAGGTFFSWSVAGSIQLESDAGRIELVNPSILPGLEQPLLGRSDVFAAFRISFDERGREFTLNPY